MPKLPNELADKWPRMDANEQRGWFWAEGRFYQTNWVAGVRPPGAETKRGGSARLLGADVSGRAKPDGVSYGSSSWSISESVGSTPWMRLYCSRFFQSALLFSLLTPPNRAMLPFPC
jgi:hypothetical protein